MASVMVELDLARQYETSVGVCPLQRLERTLQPTRPLTPASSGRFARSRPVVAQRSLRALELRSQDLLGVLPRTSHWF